MPPGQQNKTHTQKQKQYCNKFNKDFKNGPQWGEKNLFKKVANYIPIKKCKKKKSCREQLPQGPLKFAVKKMQQILGLGG